MQLLFVHGLGASRLDGIPLLLHMRRRGIKAQTFSYLASMQKLAVITQRLQERIRALAEQGDYALVGHSLGGVLLRLALQDLPADVRPPRHLFLVGSPVRATQLSQSFKHWRLFHLLSGECGQLVASPARMDTIAMPTVPTTCIVGSMGFTGRLSPFGEQPNDSIVLESELGLERFDDVARVAVRHPYMPASRLVHQVLFDRLGVAR
ncbi:hypothetical protein [Chitinimonas sp.]|uniref:esterase/lipase family protein n=1 Tax=Chitinimonas sp. TaxID=1934313 RepID=UPI002F92C91B